MNGAHIIFKLYTKNIVVHKKNMREKIHSGKLTMV